MPFIDSKVTLKLTEEQKEAVKTKLGEAITLMNKTETYLMVGFKDEYDLFFGGQKVESGAYVEVSVFGEAKPELCANMTQAICKIFKEELDIPSDRLYVTYHGVRNWGWNGKNF